MLVDILTKICVILGIILSIMYFYQIVYLIVPRFFRPKRMKGPFPKKHYAIMIAARNEEKVIGNLLDSIRQQDYPQELMTVFVIADNCTDSTAQIAAKHGAIVYTRQNKELIGKGYAISYLLDRIKEDYGYSSFDSFMIFDADNVLKHDYMTQINKVAAQGYQVFSSYRNSKNYAQSWVSSGHSIWYLHDSTHLNCSRMTLRVGCMVTGTGYGFTTELLERLGGWNFHTLTEDLEFNNWCAINKVKIGFAYNAMLYDEQPITLKVSWKQRTRWIQGGMQVGLGFFTKYPKGLFSGGWSSWSTFEAITLCMWGSALGGLCGCLTLLTTFLAGGWMGLLNACVVGLLGTYASTFLTGLLTVVFEWKKIHATPMQKILSLFTFPFYVITFLPIMITSVFKKPVWTPIEHTEAVTAETLEDEVVQ